MSHQLRLLCVATQFLTRLPTPQLREFDPSWLSQSARYFPLVGVLVGTINVGVWWPAQRWLPAGVAVGLMLAASMFVTGAFHEDGLADTCDGMGAGATAEVEGTGTGAAPPGTGTVMTGRADTANLYAVFHRAKTTAAAIRSATPPRCLMMFRMLSRPRVFPPCWIHHDAAALRRS